MDYKIWPKKDQTKKGGKGEDSSHRGPNPPTPRPSKSTQVGDKIWGNQASFSLSGFASKQV